jgi:hypothetical protein
MVASLILIKARQALSRLERGEIVAIKSEACSA